MGCLLQCDGRLGKPPSISPGSIPGRLLANAQLPQTNHVDGVAPAAAKKSHALPGDAPDLAICPVSRVNSGVQLPCTSEKRVSVRAAPAGGRLTVTATAYRSQEPTSAPQSRLDLVCRPLREGQTPVPRRIQRL